MSAHRSASLFDDDPDPVYSLVEVLAHSKPTTKAQRTFRQLIASIERKRAQLERWQAYMPRYNRRLAEELDPLYAELRTNQRQMAELIDELLSAPATARRRLGRVQRAKLLQLLKELLADVREDGDDEMLNALRDKYSDDAPDWMREVEMELARSLLNDVLGIDVGDDATNAEELLEHAQQQLHERTEVERRLEEDRQGARKARRSKAGSARFEAADARREEAAREVSQSLREIYRKLASALHPDRELDADARQRKTLLMQRVNQAYDANDLLALLGLQLEIEQIDAAHLSAVTPKRLAHYNQILREQLAEIDAELAHCVQHFQESFDDPPNRSLTPADIDLQLSAGIAHLRKTIRELRNDLVAFRDPARLRKKLERYELAQAEPGILAEILQNFDTLAPPPRRGNRRRR